jgi:hypothetical protein
MVRIGAATVVVVAVLGVLARPDVTAVRADAKLVADEDRRDRTLQTAIARAGGPKAILACGTPVTGWFITTTLAWHLGIDLDDISIDTHHGPGVYFIDRRDGTGIIGRIPKGGRTFDVGRWRVLMHCAPKRPRA